MRFIKSREGNFRKYLKRHFDLTLPEGVDLFYAKGVRVGNDELRKSQIHGELGYAACDFGFNPTNALIQNFGHLAKRNVLRLKPEAALEFAEGMDLKMDLGKSTKHMIVCFKSYVLGLGYYDAKKQTVVNKIPKKRRRKIINSI